MYNIQDTRYLGALKMRMTYLLYVFTIYQLLPIIILCCSLIIIIAIIYFLTLISSVFNAIISLIINFQLVSIDLVQLYHKTLLLPTE